MGISEIMGISLASFLIILGLAIVWMIVQGKIDLTRLISEPTGDASMSRLQLLIFTFTVAFSFFVIVAGNSPPKFPEVPNGVLALLGISAGAYTVSKGIQFSNAQGVEDRPPDVKVTPATVTYKKGEQRAATQFHADVSRTQTKTVEWSITPSIGSIDASTGVYTPPADASFPIAAETRIQVVATSTINAKGEGKAEIVLTNPPMNPPQPVTQHVPEQPRQDAPPVAAVQPVEPVRPIER
ncbi:MAG: hypothetical protein M3O35_01740 [Acidobacteriota bacterium]|nr:hypothetical protein [Acidobacteriota bacterium]